MKFDNVVSTGCSFTWGDELVDREKRYVCNIAKHFDAKLYDLSKNGNSNEMISISTINNVARLLNASKIDVINTLVIVQWSLRERLHYYSKSNNYYKVSHENTSSLHIRKSINKGITRHVDDTYIDNMDLKMFFDNHAQIPFLTYTTINKIHHTQMFLQNRGLKYIFLFASKYDLETLYLNNDELQLLRTHGVDNPRHLLPDVSELLADIDTTKIFPTPFLSFCNERNIKKTLGSHPVEDGHIQYSKHLIEFIRRLYD